MLDNLKNIFRERSARWGAILFGAGWIGSAVKLIGLGSSMEFLFKVVRWLLELISSTGGTIVLMVGGLAMFLWAATRVRRRRPIPPVVSVRPRVVNRLDTGYLDFEFGVFNADPTSIRICRTVDGHIEYRGTALPLRFGVPVAYDDIPFGTEGNIVLRQPFEAGLASAIRDSLAKGGAEIFDLSKLTIYLERHAQTKEEPYKYPLAIPQQVRCTTGIVTNRIWSISLEGQIQPTGALR